MLYVLSCHIIIHYNMVVHYCFGQYATDFAHQFSRQCPEKKDFVTVQTDQVKVKKQKRMLLVNLKELYLEFKKKHETRKWVSPKFAVCDHAGELLLIHQVRIPYVFVR